jgi:Holliday junction resolvase RusA-like endonuclease
VEIALDGAPVPKERHRFGGGRVYGTTRTARYERRLREAALAAMAGRAPFAGPVEADLLVVLAVPKGWPKARREAALSGRLLPLRRPDGDNVSKALLDGLNRVVFEDDAQVAELRIRKRYGPETGVWLRLRAIPGAEGPSRRRRQ